MGNETARILIETTIRRTLRQFPDDPERSARNLVDMALNFADGPRQQQFFQAARDVLKNEDSPYYALARDVVDHVQTQRLLGFGMALGYNSCTAGVRDIRAEERRGSCHIPWTVTLALGENTERLREIISRGEQLGIHTWALWADGNPAAALPLVQSHPESAFILFCRPGNLGEELLDQASELQNLMLAIRAEEGAIALCHRLRGGQMLYSLCFVYGDRHRESILNGELLAGVEELHPVFTVLMPEPDCSQETRLAVHHYAMDSRRGEHFKTIVWEYAGDTELVDAVISGEGLCAGFDRLGNLLSSRPVSGNFNLQERDLPDIFHLAFPTEGEQP